MLETSENLQVEMDKSQEIQMIEIPETRANDTVANHDDFTKPMIQRLLKLPSCEVDRVNGVDGVDKGNEQRQPTINNRINRTN